MKSKKQETPVKNRRLDGYESLQFMCIVHAFLLGFLMSTIVFVCFIRLL